MIAGIAWFERRDFATLEQVKLEPSPFATYDEWLEHTITHGDRLKAKGVKSIRIVIESLTFKAWCERKNYKLTSEARNEYVREKAAELIRSSSIDG